MKPFPDNYIKLIVAVDQLLTAKTEPDRLFAMSDVMNRMEICRKDLLSYAVESLNEPDEDSK